MAAEAAKSRLIQVLAQIYPPWADETDRAILDSAAAAWKRGEAADLCDRKLAEISAQHGVDFAVALLYMAIRRYELHGPMIQSIEREAAADAVDPPTIVIVPGAFYKHHDHTGADGSRLILAAQKLGWPTPQIVPVGSLDSMHRNAQRLIDHLASVRTNRIVIASLSKGSADVATALRLPRGVDAMQRVCAWISLSGLVFGTPLISWLRQRRLRTLGVHVLLWLRGLRFSPLDELNRGPNTPLDSVPQLPAHIRAIHVLGFPTPRHLRHPWSPRGFARLAELGPNDGGGILLADALRLPGFVFPVWGADHYLSPAWDFSPVLRSILLHAAQSQNAASTIPASKSTT